MGERAPIPTDVMADVLVSSRRRCCLCFGLSGDTTEKKGQVAHLDHDSSDSSLENLVFLCLNHHDEYDSRRSQAKGLTVQEVRRYRGQLERYVAQHLPLSDADVARLLVAGLDRPAFRTPFREESSLPRFRQAIAETIGSINCGRTLGGSQLPGKGQLRDPGVRASLDAVVEKLVELRAAFDGLMRSGDIRECGCRQPDCPVHMLSRRAVSEMDRSRQELLAVARAVDPNLSVAFYELREISFGRRFAEER